MRLARRPAGISNVSASPSNARRRRAASAASSLASANAATATAEAVIGIVAPTWPVPGTPDLFPPSPHGHTRADISDASPLGRNTLAAVDGQAFRTLIGAGTGNGTSNLALGTTATTAAPGNHTHSQYVDSAQAATIADERIALNGGGTGGGSVYAWRYVSGAYPTLPSTKPAGVVIVAAVGPLAPSVLPSWIGNGPTQVPSTYDYVPLT